MKIINFKKTIIDTLKQHSWQGFMDEYRFGIVADAIASKLQADVYKIFEQYCDYMKDNVENIGNRMSFKEWLYTEEENEKHI